MKMQKLVFVYGTRPEFIKMYPLICEARKRKNISALVCSTGQHQEMLNQLYLYFDFKPDLDFQLMKRNQKLSDLHADTMKAVTAVLEEHQPDWLIVQGDTTSAHAAAMAGFYHQTPVAHVEAGLRTYNIQSPFPEEMNRRAIGLVAKAHFCPTGLSAENLSSEKNDSSAFVEVTGNTSIDCLKLVCEQFEKNQTYQQLMNEQFAFLKNKKFVLATLHRRESFGEAQQNVLRAMLEIVKQNKIQIVFPVHPNPQVRASVEKILQHEMGRHAVWIENTDDYHFSDDKGRIFLLDPLDYPSLVYAMKNCEFLLTDSGGLQEEAPSFGKKILVLRQTTERPEGVQLGFAKLVGTDFDRIVSESFKIIENQNHWKEKIPVNPYGDGQASARILDSLVSH